MMMALCCTEKALQRGRSCSESFQDQFCVEVSLSDRGARWIAINCIGWQNTPRTASCYVGIIPSWLPNWRPGIATPSSQCWTRFRQQILAVRPSSCAIQRRRSSSVGLSFRLSFLHLVLCFFKNWLIGVQVVATPPMKIAQSLLVEPTIFAQRTVPMTVPRPRWCDEACPSFFDEVGKRSRV